MASVSEELKRERELRGISLEQIAEDTKIGLRFLMAIDSGKLDVIPGEFYRRSYVRAYAAYLGIDPDRMASSYDFQASRAVIAKSPSSSFEHRDREARGRRFAVWGGLLLAVLAVGGGAAVWSGGASRGGERPRPAAAHRYGVSPEPRPVSDVARDPTLGATTPVIERDEPDAGEEDLYPLQIRLKVNESCWLEVRADGDVVAQGLMPGGFEKHFRAREEIHLWLGNAGGISYWINGRPGKSLGQTGQVRKEIRITPENLSEFLGS